VRRKLRLVEVILWVPGVAIAIGLTTLLVHDLKNPRDACERHIPPFEGIAVEEASRSAVPPLVRCRLVDRDPLQAGEIHRAGAWGPVGLGALALFDLGVLLVIPRYWLTSRRRTEVRPAP
jgi:hypothetical protein